MGEIVGVLDIGCWNVTTFVVILGWSVVFGRGTGHNPFLSFLGWGWRSSGRGVGVGVGSDIVDIVVPVVTILGIFEIIIVDWVGSQHHNEHQKGKAAVEEPSVDQAGRRTFIEFTAVFPATQISMVCILPPFPWLLLPPLL